MNNDGQISFTEFFFFMLLLQIPSAKLRKRFKKYPEGKMTKEEFSVEIRELRKTSSAGKKQQNQVALDARAIKASEEDFKATNKGVCEVLFEGKQTITYQDIMDLKEDFREDLWHYEFHTYEPDEKTGRISIESFLRSLAVCLHGRKVEKYMRRIKKVVKELEKMDVKE